MQEDIQPFPKKSYEEILREIGGFNYQIFEKNEPIPGKFAGDLPFKTYNWVLAGTAGTLRNYSFINQGIDITIPKGELLIRTRLFRFDDSHGAPHYNADDYLIFPTLKGQVVRMKRNRAQDHFVKIVDLANIQSIAEAFHLPNDKKGPIRNYSENGASLPIKIIEKINV